MEDGFGHVIKNGMKHLERVFLERKFDYQNLYTIPQKLKSNHTISIMGNVYADKI